MNFGDERIPDRVWDKLHPEPNTGCWLWSGAASEDGYGCSSRPLPGQKTMARPVHRWLLEMATGELGVQARHVHCRQPRCCNPDHLVWGSNSDNQKDSVKDGTHVWARTTHCPEGHEYTEDNIYWRHSPRRRVCLTCKRALDKINAQRYRDREKLKKEKR